MMSSAGETVRGAALLAHLAPAWKCRDVASPRFEWSEELGAWSVYCPGLSSRLLASRELKVPPYEALYAHIEGRTGLDFSSCRRGLSGVPLAHDGEQHRELRRACAVAITANADKAVDAFSAQLASRCAVLQRPGRFDLTKDLFGPCASATIARLTDLETAPEIPLGSISKIFDRFLGLNRRKRVNAELKRLEVVAEECPSAHATEIRSALNILGRDALLGSLQESFIREIERQPDKPLASIAWPERISQTGVPYIERIAIRDGAVDGIELKEGQRLRLYLNAGNARDGFDGSGFFGAGVHKCLGEPMTQRIWQVFAQAMGSVSSSVRICDVGYAEHDHVFSCPTRLVVEISAAASAAGGGSA